MAARKVRKRSSNGLDNAAKTEEDLSGKAKGNGEESLYFKKGYKNISNVTPNKRAKLTIHKNLGRLFYIRPCEELAQKLLGKLLYRILDNGEVLCGRIVETEAYLGVVDKACHAYGGKKTERCEPLYMAPGTAYVYFIYGIYHCLNISSQEPGACVLIRALEPLQGGWTKQPSFHNNTICHAIDSLANWESFYIVFSFLEYNMQSSKAGKV